MSKQFWAILAAIAVVFFGVVYFSNNGDSSSNGTGNGKAQPTEHVKGNGSSGVKLVEYADYQCPVCASFFPVTKQVQDKYSEQVYFQFRNLPLPSIHQNAVSAARAAEAASLQGKFWEMHDLIFQNQSLWSNSTSAYDLFLGMAKQLELDEEKFASDYKSAAVNNAINADVAAFDKTGEDKATPTYFLDGKKIDNSELVGEDGQPSVEAFSKVLDEAIAAKKQ